MCFSYRLDNDGESQTTGIAQLLSVRALTLAYEPRLKASLTPVGFMRQRLVRLWPMLAVGILIGGLGSLLPGNVHQLRSMALSLCLIPVFIKNETIYIPNPPQWSLSFELIANFFHTLLLRRLSNNTLLAFTGACGLILAWQGLVVGVFDIGWGVDNWWGGFARVGFSYTLGVWLGRRYEKGRNQLRIRRWWGLAVLPVPVIILSTPLWPLSHVKGDCLAVFLLLPAALWLAAQTSPPKTAQPILGWLGRLSYPLYASHAPILALSAQKIHSLPPSAQTYARIAALFLILAAAHLLAMTPLATGRWRKRPAASPG